MNGLHEQPLILFTVLAQAVVGAVWVLCFSPSSKQQNRGVFVLLLLLAVGFASSVLHLGSPWRAFNALNRVGESMLSNEIASGMLFFIALGCYWLIRVFTRVSGAMQKTWLFLTVLLGLLFMLMMSKLYQIPTVPTWSSSLTVWQFFLTLLCAGSALGVALFQAPWAKKSAVLGGVLIAIVVVYQGMSLNQIHSAIQSAADLVPDYAPLNALRLSLIAVGIGLLWRPVQAWHYVGAALIIGAEMIGRSLFYVLHMTVGTAVSAFY